MKNLMVIEDQSSELDGLSRKRIFRRCWIDEGSMRSQPGHTRELTIETFDQNKLIWLHPFHVFPLMIRVELDRHGLSMRRVRVQKLSWLKIVDLVHRSEVAERKREVERRVFDRSPQINDLVSMLQ